MPKTKISEFSATPANNTDIDSINISEGCAPSGINDAIRELMAQLKDFQTGAVGDSFNGPVGTTTAAAGAFTTLSASGAVTLSGGTANGVAYLNGSKVVTSGSALTFDGTNLGVGVSPASDGAIHVHRAGASFPTIKITNGTTGTGNLDGFDLICGSGGEAYVYNRENQPILFGVNNSEQMRLTSTGLGIGTSSPAYKLQVAGTVGISGIITSTVTNGQVLAAGSGNTAGIYSNFANTGGTLQYGIDNSTGSYIYSGSSNYAGFIGTTGATSLVLATNSVVRATIDSSGNLGLGTASSFGKLTINSNGAPASSGSMSTGLTVTNGSTGTAINIGTFDAGSYNYIQSAYVNNANTARALAFFLGNTQAMTLDASGNLGVGTTSPTQKLNVNGIGLFEGSAQGNIVIQKTGTNGFSLFSSAAGTLGFYDQSAGTERARIDSSGNFLVGTTSSNLSSASRGVIEVNGASTAYIGLDTGGTLRGTFYSNGSIVGLATATLPLTFGTTGGTEWGRFDSSGNLLVGTTSQLSGGSYGNHQIQASVGDGGRAALVVYNNSGVDNSDSIVAIKSSATTTSSQRFIQFYADAGATAMGGIVGNGASNVQFAAISDAREKTNVQPISGSLEKISALNPVEFDWIKSGEHVKSGFIAQDVEQVFPEFVVENMSGEGEESRKGLTGGMTSGIIPHLVKAIQELKAEFDAYKASHP